MPSGDDVAHGDTGEHLRAHKEIVVSFDRFRIKVSLTLDNRFVGIVEVSLKKDFRSPEDKARTQGFHDVADLYDD